MLQSMALFAALTMTPAQGAGLTLSNPRITYGELGSTRPDNKLLPGDIFFLSFDIDGIKVSDAGRVKYGMAMEVVDATGKSIFKQMPVERRRLPAAGRDQAAGPGVRQRRRRPAGRDLHLQGDGHGHVGQGQAGGQDPGAEVRGAAAGLRDRPAVHGRRPKGGDPRPAGRRHRAGPVRPLRGHRVRPRQGQGNQPNITIEMVVYGKDSQPTLAKPTVKQIPDEADGKVDEKVVGVPMRFLVPLNREGGFLIRLKATDNISKKTQYRGPAAARCSRRTNRTAGKAFRVSGRVPFAVPRRMGEATPPHSKPEPVMSSLQDRIAQFRKMATDDPDNELGHFRLGQLLIEAGQHAEAVKSFERTLELSPQFSKVFQLLGQCLAEARPEGRGHRRLDARAGKSPTSAATTCPATRWPSCCRAGRAAPVPEAAQAAGGRAARATGFRCQRPGCLAGHRAPPAARARRCPTISAQPHLRRRSAPTAGTTGCATTASRSSTSCGST